MIKFDRVQIAPELENLGKYPTMFQNLLGEFKEDGTGTENFSIYCNH